MDEVTTALIRVLPFVAILLVIRLRLKQGKFTKETLALQKPKSNSTFLLWYVGFLVFILLTEFTLYHFGLLETSKWKHGLLPSVIRIAGMVVLAPVAEELLFRGIFLNKLLHWKLNKHVSVFVQSILFVVLHSFAYENTLSSNIGIAQSFIDATIYAYARFSTQSIYTPMAMHATGNLTATLEMLFL